MAQICSSQFGNFSLFFFKPNYHGNSAKGEGVGRTRARALAKIHSKKFKFYTKHLALRVYKKMFLLGSSGQYVHKLYTKKVVCSVLLVYSILLHYFSPLTFLKR